MSDTTFTRREIITTAAGVAVAAGCTPRVSAQTRRVPGIELYTVRASMAQDVDKTLQAIAGIGYPEVEFAGYFEHSAKEIRAMLDRYGLVSPSANVLGEDVWDDPQPVVDFAAEVGHDWVTIAWAEPENRQTADDWRHWVEVANRLGEACRANGMRAAYHSHDFEFQPIDGIVPFDLLLEETDPALLDFQMDFYWVRRAGKNIRDVLAMAPERMTMAHIKDMDAAGEMADVGDGEIDFGGLLADPVAASIRHCFVERDDSEDPFRTAAASYRALSSILKYPAA